MKRPWLAAWRGLPALFVLGSSQRAQEERPVLRPPKGPGSVLIVLADDLGIDALPFYGLDPAVPPDLTPNLSQLAAAGVLFENVWACPKCSPGRAELQTGRDSFRTGIGQVMEAGDVGLSPDELTLPEMLTRYAPVPYASAFFGKWHLDLRGSDEVCPATAIHGYQYFAGSLFAVQEPAANYCSWNERRCAVHSTPLTQPRLTYMPDSLFGSASTWIAAQDGPWLCVLAPQQPYDIPHVPPPRLQSVVSGVGCVSCAPADRSCYDAAVQALDSEIGELLTSLGPDWWRRVTIIFTADNGTPNLVNRYWPAFRAKTTLFEGGVRVPLIIAGRAVDPARQGSVVDDLVSLTDVYRTVASLGGAALPADVAEDSFDLTPLLARRSAGTGRTHLVAETFARNAAAPPYEEHKIAIRDRRWKLLYDWSNRTPIKFYNLERDPRETVNLLAPSPPAPGTPPAEALANLKLRIHALLGERHTPSRSRVEAGTIRKP